MPDYRVEFDADVTFLNGGSLQAREFRLDLPRRDVSEAQIAALFVESLGLLMTDQVLLSRVRVFQAPHKGSRGGPADPGSAPGGAGDRGGRDQGGWRLVELSHPIQAGMVTYPGLPGPEITPYLTREAARDHYAEGTEFAIDRISMVGNTGTYLDSPFHRYADGIDLADLPLASFAELPAVVVGLVDSARRGVDVGALAALPVAGCAVLLHTGWDRHWATERYAGPAPFLTAEASRWLVDQGVRLVGIDSVNIDDTTGDDRPAHSVLLGAGIPVVEHLTGLDQLPVTGARFTAAPARVRAFGTFPVRAYAAVPREAGDS
ncbi:MAG TPA: cyclase family protein [Cryptosporangiaceae bacterium]|nr:cyclase family protein [Cryptosporangiaceae bacterium]